MSNTAASLNRKLNNAADLKAVVRTMKAMAASNINQYEQAVSASDNYFRTVQLGLAACFHQHEFISVSAQPQHKGSGVIAAVVFGSDQGLVGQFNDVIVEFSINTLKELPGRKIIWPVGERIQSRVSGRDVEEGSRFLLPTSMGAITPLIGRILVEIETQRETGNISQVYLFYNCPKTNANYTPMYQRLLPLDDSWQESLAAISWPTHSLPEILNHTEEMLSALVREYIFVSLFRACTESLASENASRLAAMQRAEKNIEELLDSLNQTYHRLRQSSIDEELFDVVSGFEALGGVS
jgi:F-type H+-transporting ATPase subunit gamma